MQVVNPGTVPWTLQAACERGNISRLDVGRVRGHNRGSRSNPDRWDAVRQGGSGGWEESNVAVRLQGCGRSGFDNLLRGSSRVLTLAYPEQ